MEFILTEKELDYHLQAARSITPAFFLVPKQQYKMYFV